MSNDNCNMESIWQEIGINAQHVCETQVPGRYQLICDKQWLQTLERRHKTVDFPIWPQLDNRAHPTGTLPHPWTRVLVQTYQKQSRSKVYPLPNNSLQNSNIDCYLKTETDFLPYSYSQAVANVANENFNNLWSAAYQKYQLAHTKQYKQQAINKTQCHKSMLDYDTALQQLIQRVWHCPVMHSNGSGVTVSSLENNPCHANLMAAIISIETSAHISVIFYPPAVTTSIYDCITYSPAVLNKNTNKALFIIYQIFQLAKSFQAAGLFLGDVRLQDFLMRDNIWLQLVPRLEVNLLQQPQQLQNKQKTTVFSTSDISEANNTLEADESVDLDENSSGNSTKLDLKFVYDLSQFTLREYCEMWCNGLLSNFDYLTILNNASGRSFHNPAYHHIMPWVTDFSARNGTNWRDLSKSKYRLNKGDAHLDVMFSQSSKNNNANYISSTKTNQNTQIPHHVSDFLSEITYFVYMARRTPQSILCEHVRPIWVPAEYPASIMRLQAWTPDECIPQFYTDPLIFKSIHEDLADLELPAWATCPEDFVSKHREALESQHVSQRLHHWIDLNFGYKLVGKAAIKSKNVCLSLVDQHKEFSQRGIVQLFNHPHPPKRVVSPWFSQQAPRLAQHLGVSQSSEQLHSSSFYASQNFIDLPKEYNPCALLQNFESMQMFFARTFLSQKAQGNIQQKINSADLLFEESSEHNSYTNQLFAIDSVTTPIQLRNLLAPSLHQRQLHILLAEKQATELQVLGCLVVEIFAIQRLRPLLLNVNNASFQLRLQACRTVFESYQQEIPKCLRRLVAALLENPKEIVNEQGLPLPHSASQLLQPILSQTLLPFGTQYYACYALMRSLHEYRHCATLLQLYTHFNCNGKDCSRFAAQDRENVLFERKIAECQVMSCCAHLSNLLETVAFEQFTPLELILPHCIELLTAEQTSILTAWHLFDILAHALGKTGTQQHLLLPIIKLYDAESFDRGMIAVRTRPKIAHTQTNCYAQLQFSTNSSFKSRKSVKLYHHSFLLRLIVRFGLACFLENFITPLIEAVGGYKEPVEGTGFHFHISKDKTDNAEHELCNWLTTTSPLIAAVPIMSDEDANAKLETEDLFTFDDDIGSSEQICNSCTNEQKSLDSFDTNVGEEASELLDPTAINSSTTITSSSSFYGVLQQSYSNPSLVNEENNPPKNNDNTLTTKSPTIDIPVSALERSFRLHAIDCDIGSRKSVDSFEIITQQAVDEQKQKQQQQQRQENTSSQSEASVTNESLQASVITRMSEARVAQNNRISEMSAESLMWLSHRLGPVLTCCYITRNLLKMLSLCYVGQENLLPEIGSGRDQFLDKPTSLAGNLNYFTVAEACVIGDQNAARVLECLMSIVGIFGEEVILLQYFPHLSELIALSNNRVTGSLEGAIISTLQMLKCIIPCLTDATLMERLKDLILEPIVLPIITLLSSTQFTMPSGYLGRSVLARKLLDALYTLCLRIGPDMAKEYLCIPALRSFFSIFNKAYDMQSNSEYSGVSNTENVCVSAEDELRDVFSMALAHNAYVGFLQFLGNDIMQHTLENLDFILLLCHDFEQPGNNRESLTKDAKIKEDTVDFPISQSKLLCEHDAGAANSFGTNVIGNRIEVNEENASKVLPKKLGSTEQELQQLDMVTYKFESLPTTRHLKGNWLAYWRHEVSRPEKDIALSLKQIKLQSFVGHTNSVRAIVALDNENSFMSASKDKTVKLWSLRSEGDGSKMSNCQFTYNAHKKSVHALSFLEAMRFAVSCDSSVHIWDPFIGRPLGILESPKHNPVTVVKCMPSPSPLVIAGFAECALKVLDTRCMKYICEWKIGAAGLQGAGVTLRCLSVAPSGNWLAVGLSSGSIVTLDTRTGMILNNWHPMECDLLQLLAANDQHLISSALDHSLAVWHANDGILHYQLKPPPEPAHYLHTVGSELVFATTGNRIGIYADINTSRAVHSITKLRSETFRGVLTSLAVLPLNRTFLAGNESGNIVLLC